MYGKRGSKIQQIKDATAAPTLFDVPTNECIGCHDSAVVPDFLYWLE